MKISALRLVLTAAVAIFLSLNSWAQTASGRIKAARVENAVSKLGANGAAIQIKDGDLLTESDVVTTGKSSSVVLVFENGSSVKLGADSRLAIDEFKMDPLADTVDTSTLKAEPSVSQTKLNLAYGEMVGDVKHLNTSSTYSIKTPVGAAGIRGTIYRIVFRPSADGKAFFTVSTAEGRVVMTGVTTAEIPIPAGKEVAVTVDVPDNPSTPPAAPVVVTRDIPPATTAVITAATVSIAQGIKDTTTTPTTTTPTTTPTTPTTTTPTPPPAAQPPATQLTPGAGGS